VRVKAADLHMEFRCSEDWGAMPGDARTRHCAKCDRQVVNLSAHSELGARLVLAGTRRPCVRFAAAPDGRVRFRPSRLVRLVAAVAALASAPVRADPGTLTVRVVDPDELPIPGTSITVVDAAGVEVGTATTDDVGEARFDGPAGVGWTFDATKAGFTGVRVTGMAPGMTQSVVLAPGEFHTVTVGGISARSRRSRLPAAWHAARVEIAAAGAQWERVAVRCGGYASALRARFVGPDAAVDGVPIGEECRARLTGGARPLLIEFAAEGEVVSIDAADSRGARPRR
jgi:hypothetical protein